jgi:amino-acid N-acetyltransferase
MNSQTDLPPAQTGATTPPAPDDSAVSHAQFVDWMRSVAPYIHKFRNRRSSSGSVARWCSKGC